MSTENNKDFQWNEDLVKELLSFIHNDKAAYALFTGNACLEDSKMSPKQALLDVFKELNGEKRHPEYEILSVKSNWSEIVYSDQSEISRYDSAPPHFAIHSVRRLSDGEVFELGKKVQHVEGHYSAVITEFYLPSDERGEMWFYCDGHKDTVKNLNNFTNLPTPQPLFTTEDGVDIYEGEDCYICKKSALYDKWNIHKWFKVCKEGLGGEGEVYFSSEKSAEAWREAQKPKILFTTEDGVDITDHKTPLYMVLAKATWQTGETTTERHLRRAVSGSSAWKYFANKYNRDRYVLLNKPTLSVSDVMDLYQNHSENFETFLSAVSEAAKAKL